MSLSEQGRALLDYRLTEAWTRLYRASPDHALLVHFRLRDGQLCWNRNDGGLHELGFHLRFSTVSGTFLTDEFWAVPALEEPLPEKLERYIGALEDAVEW